MSDQDRFSDRLISAEQVDAKRKERFQMEMQQILNRTLTPGRRAACAAVAVVGLGFGINSLVLALTLHITGEYAGWMRAVFGVAAVFGFGWAALAGRTAIKGTMNLRRDPPAMARLTWTWTLFVVAATLVVAALELNYNSSLSIFMAACAVAYLTAYLPFIIVNVVQQSELKTREKMLEIELRLAEMAEKLEKKPG